MTAPDRERLPATGRGAFALGAVYKSRSQRESDPPMPSGGITHSQDAYALAARLAEGFHYLELINIGRGSAQATINYAGSMSLIGVDIPEHIKNCRNVHPGHVWLSADLEHPIALKTPVELLERSVLVCANVLERLLNPDSLIQSISEWMQHVPLAVLTTAARKSEDQGPPADPVHIREWTPEDFESYLKASGLNVEFIGLTADENEQRTTTLAIARRSLEFPPTPADFKVSAFMTAFNEVDMIESSVRHLHSNGVKVHFIDNWSTDGTFELATKLQEEGIVDVLERFPADGPSGTYDWRELLIHVDRVAGESDADWCIHHDSDEIRLGPWLDVSLRDAFWRVETKGCNAVDFTCINFIPVDDSFEKDHDLSSLQYFEFGKRAGHFQQIKAWKNQHQSVQLPRYGGHEAIFEDRRVYPYKFLLKHYPIRSQQHGERKVLRERHERWNKNERNVLGWHRHYDKYLQQPSFIKKPEDLLRYGSDAAFFHEYLVERLTGIGIVRGAYETV